MISNKPPKISEFKDEYRWLSNFWWLAVPVYLPDDDNEYPTVEHAYVAAKTDCQETRNEIQTLGSPGRAKVFGRTIAVREDWDSDKLSIMYDLVRQKFFNNEDLKQVLLDTGGVKIEEGNGWGDTFWGICPPRSGKGQNHLGFIIMKVRRELRKENE